MNHYYTKLRLIKITAAMTACLCAAVPNTKAQNAAQYSFTATAGTYTNVTGGTDVNTIEVNDASSSMINIGFNFVFCGTTYTQVKANSNGWLSFANIAPAVGPTRNNTLANLADISPAVLPLWDNLTGAGGTAVYKLEGVSPNQTFTFEWRNWTWDNSATSASISFQVVLHETTNVIDFVYRQEAGSVVNGSNGATIAINRNGTDFLALNGSGTAPTASTTITTNIATRPASGQVYTFTPPQLCSGTPAAGTVSSSTNSSCSPYTTTLTGVGYSNSLGIDLQWQSSPDSIAWTDIAGETGSTYTASITATPAYYRLAVKCGAAVAYTPGVKHVVATIPTSAPYAALPFVDSFENWTSVCYNFDRPGGNWITNPSTGNNAWRRNNQGNSASWTTQGQGAYTPTSTNGSFSARFHSQSATSGSEGIMDLYLNMSAAGTKYISFDHINTGGLDTLFIELSTDGGANFTQLGYRTTASSWTPVMYTTTSTSAISVLRFRAKSDATASDIGMDNLRISTTQPCLSPSALSASANNAIAYLNWAENGSATLWEVEYGTTTFAPGTGAGTKAYTSTKPYTISGLTAGAGYSYFVRAICGVGDTSAYSARYTFSAATVANDVPAFATALTLNAACTAPPYTNAGATHLAGEPVGTCSATTGYSTVWFKFTAPASGMIKATTDFAANALDDTRLALFSASDSTNFSTFSIISCDDDNGVTSTLNSIIFATGLVPGQTYYLSVDDYDGSSTGTFCLEVRELDNTMLAATSTCATGGQAPYANGVSNYTGWVPLVNANGALLALVRKPTGGAVDNFTSAARQFVNTAATRQTNGQYYLDRNFMIANSSAGSYDLQLFFTNTELNALQAVDANATLSNLVVTRQSGNTCQTAFTPATGTNAVLPQVASGAGSTVSYIQVQTPGFSNFFIHAGPHPLLIQLASIAAANEGSRNRVDWTTTAELKGDVFAIERSADGENFTTVGNLEAKGAAGNYTYWDNAPMSGLNYYRLQLRSVDGNSSYSQTVKAFVNDNGSFVIKAYPNPVTNMLSIRTYGAVTGTATISIIDITGKTVYTAYAKSASTEISMTGFPAGAYLVRYTDGTHTQLLRIQKR